MRLLRVANGDYVNIDNIAYIAMFDAYATVYVMGTPMPITVTDTDYAKLKSWLAATADQQNQPMTKNKANQAAMSTDTSDRTDTGLPKGSAP